MKIKPSNTIKLAFFSTVPLEYGGGAEIITMHTAHAFDIKKMYAATVLTYKRGIANQESKFFNWMNKLQYGKIANEDNRYTTEEVKLTLGRVPYKKVTFRQIIDKIPSFDYIFVRSDIPSLLPVFFSVIRKPSLRKRIIIQFHTPLRYNNTQTFSEKFHNVIYLSPIYRIWIQLLSKKFQVLNNSDKKILKGASLIKIPAEKEFFTHPKANTKVGKKRTVIIAARLTHQKGIDMLPTLFKYLTRKKALDSFKFLIAGTGDMEDIVRSVTKKYKNVKFVKNINHTKMPAFLSKGNIFLMLSRYEGSPVALAESLAMGLLVIAFRIPGLYSKQTKSFIDFAEPFNIQEIGNDMIKIVNMSKSEIKDRSQKSIEYAEHNFKLESYIKKLENLLSQA